MADVSPASFEYYKEQVKLLEALAPSQFPGKDISMLVLAFSELPAPLMLAGHYQPHYTSSLVTAALKAGGPTSDEFMMYFKTEVNGIKKRLNTTLLKLPSMS